MTRAAVCVIYNPAAGKGRGGQRLNKLRRVLGARAAFRPTDREGHAEELALAAAQEGFPIVAAAGGGGPAHDVANGILRSHPRGRTFVRMPPRVPPATARTLLAGARAQ